MKTILITGAGGGGSNNLIRSLAGVSDLRFVGANIDPWSLLRSQTEVSYQIPHSSDVDAYLGALNTIVERESVDLILPTNDTETHVISEYRDRLDAAVALPEHAFVDLCRDKLAFHLRCEELGVPVARTRVVSSLDELPERFAEVRGEDSDALIWCRMRVGNASKGALPVQHPEQARQWIAYWCDMRGAEVDDFIVGEYLPGRDWAFQGLWIDGRLVIAKTCERREYIFAGKTPAGRFSTPRVGCLVDEPAVNKVCVEAMETLAPRASGIFAIDLKESTDGVPSITEINAGRFFRINPALNLVGEHNMAELFVQWAFGDDEVDVPERDRFSDIGEETTYYLCDLDEEPALVGESRLAETIDLRDA